MKYRIEKDALGVKEIECNALYGIQTQRARENFTVVDTTVDREFIIALAKVKRACAYANVEVGVLDPKTGSSIIEVCEEIESGLHQEWFITTAIQGGAGTSINMNMNEVISNRAAQRNNLELGKYKWMPPNDHVNL